ncbi:ArsR family transcriptional regulator [Ktedonosporobacter rubrisoli]|uniref:ArsR family transcriptional regulator n=1 Tax=Ktedonosporobacter rubrisoli TaxID=2509675 RepID=A0A4P6K184_KTERU|nr:metalloregulator ArsR/SmtB family transcription factor [Ktedonosporobacter rubrisoli]QBD81420.1 ArsR family transcriptional regulator [Ktedonosporobacter rubrisoli]
MDENNQLFTLAQALADRRRLIILQQLMEGPATVSELQSLTGGPQSTVSTHLAVLRERGLVVAARQGRQMFYKLRDASVGQLVESLTVVAGMVPAKLWKSPQLIMARTCYDHLAGRYGVALFEALLEKQAIEEPGEARGEIELGPAGKEIFGSLELDLEALRRERRRFAFACPDWTERRPHLGGTLGAALWAHFIEHGWAVKQQGTRAIIVTDLGKQRLREQLGVRVEEKV